VDALLEALLVAGFPVAFRATCYYYRKAYYRAFFLDPPNCSEAAQRWEPRKEGYRGERALFVVNNLVSKLNDHHPAFAWISLPAVVFTDLYVRLVASGVVTDLRFF
jgi:hypothetical protein